MTNPDLAMLAVGALLLALAGLDHAVPGFLVFLDAPIEIAIVGATRTAEALLEPFGDSVAQLLLTVTGGALITSGAMPD